MYGVSYPLHPSYPYLTIIQSVDHVAAEIPLHENLVLQLGDLFASLLFFGQSTEKDSSASD